MRFGARGQARGRLLERRPTRRAESPLRRSMRPSRSCASALSGFCCTRFCTLAKRFVALAAADLRLHQRRSARARRSGRPRAPCGRTAAAWSKLPPASKMRPTSTWTTGLRGFRNAPCCACAIASPHFLASPARIAVPSAANASPDRASALRRLARDRLRLGRLALGEQRPGQLDAGRGRGAGRGTAPCGPRLRRPRRGRRRAAPRRARHARRRWWRPPAIAFSALATAAGALLRPRLRARQHGERRRRGLRLRRLLRVLQRVRAGATRQIEGGQRGEGARRGRPGSRSPDSSTALAALAAASSSRPAFSWMRASAACDSAPGTWRDDLLHGLDRLVGLSLLDLGLGARDRFVDSLVGGGHGNGEREERQGADQDLHQGSRPHYFHGVQWIIRPRGRRNSLRRRV